MTCIDEMTLGVRTFSTTFDIRLHQSPVDQRVVDEGLEHRHKGLLVLSQDFHADLARVPKASFDTADL